jgi:hypothetical protein
MYQVMASSWQVVGLVLALTLIFASGVAVWTRWASNAKLSGQTIWHVVVGVAGVVVIAGIWVGFEVSGYLLVCFTVASVPMAVEYFGRLKIEEAKAQKVREESLDEHTGADREE